MIKCNTCIVGITLLLSSVFMTIFKQDRGIFFEFTKLLDETQKKRYHKIIKERITAYVMGIVIGIILGIVYYKKYPTQPYPICTFLAIIYITKLAVYYFWPKSPLMLYSLNTKEQTDAWATIYEEMKRRYKMSLLIGFIGYVLLFNGL